MQNPHTLICSAVESELSEFQTLTKEYIAMPVGIGLIESVIGLANTISQYPSIEKIIFIGTCGAYPSSSLKILDLCQSHSHKLIGSASVLGESYFPDVMKKEIHSSKAIQSNLTERSSATVLEITSSDELAEKIEKSESVEIEHMEIFSIARFAEKKKLNCSAFFAVSNIVGENSHKEWLEYRSEAEKLIQNHVLNTI